MSENAGAGGAADGLSKAENISTRIARDLSVHGLRLRGGLNFDLSESPPEGYPGIRAVLLIGNAGAAYWPHFVRWRAEQAPGLANPLDAWCRDVIGAIASRFGARAVAPSDRPFLPFQQWAMRAESLRASPIGILIHPEYGLWHAYRGALLFDAEISIQQVEAPIHLCDLCVGKPCLKACPVNAYSAAGFAYGDCLDFARGADGAACRTAGCIDRNACPHGAGYRYPAEVQAFHMASFLRPGT